MGVRGGEVKGQEHEEVAINGDSKVVRMGDRRFLLCIHPYIPYTYHHVLDHTHTHPMIHVLVIPPYVLY